MKNRGGRKINTVWSYLSFFLLIAAMITIAIPIYEAVRGKTDGDGITIAIVMMFIIIFLAGICTVVDIFRRKNFVEKPVEKILDATQKIASGDFSVKIPIARAYGKYNIYDCIVDNINTMAAELSQNELLKTDFISNVSHELKTPLAIIQNYCMLLRDESLDAQTRKTYLDSLLQASKRLTSLITDILKLNKLENREIAPEVKEIDVARLAEEVLVGYVDLAEAKGIELDINIEDARARTSESYLEIALSNLISNAIKFTESGGKISVSLKKFDGKVRLSVTDTGCGISPEAGRRIFDKFYQGDTSHAQEGNGLGLALVKKVIDILGGTISVESELGKGSTFTIVLNGCE